MTGAILFLINIHRLGFQCPWVNWNDQLEPYTTDVRFIIKVLPLGI